MQEGWGAELGFPAMVLDEDGADVPGFVFDSEHLSEHWQRLDDFEGDGYARVVTTARLDGCGAIEAYVYVLRSA